MVSAWGVSWSTFWGNAWGAISSGSAAPNEGGGYTPHSPIPKKIKKSTIRADILKAERKLLGLDKEVAKAEKKAETIKAKEGIKAPDYTKELKHLRLLQTQAMQLESMLRDLKETQRQQEDEDDVELILMML